MLEGVKNVNQIDLLVYLYFRSCPNRDFTCKIYSISAKKTEFEFGT